MKTTEIVFIRNVADLLIDYGIEGLVEIIKTWKITGSPTIEEIEVLRDMVPPAATFFNPRIDPPEDEPPDPSDRGDNP